MCTNSQFCNYTCSSNSVCELAVQYGIGSALGDVATEKVQIGPYSGTVQFVRVLTQQTSVFSQVHYIDIYIIIFIHLLMIY